MKPSNPCARCGSRCVLGVEGEVPRKARARAFVDEVNTRTVCAHCDKQPIEWHNPEHVEQGRERYRIGNMVKWATVEEIQAEIGQCTPLCRRCHMREDGRMRTLMVQAMKPKAREPRSCGECRRPAKPLRRGLCAQCYERHRAHRRRSRLCATCPSTIAAQGVAS